MLKRPKEKGRRAEAEVAELIRGFGYAKTFRQPLSGAISFMKGDIASHTWPYFTEIKNCETWMPLAWYRKAESESENKPPIVVMTKNGDDYYCFMRFSDFLMALKNAPIETIKIPPKAKKLTLQESSGLMFSKEAQVRKGKS